MNPEYSLQKSMNITWTRRAKRSSLHRDKEKVGSAGREEMKGADFRHLGVVEWESFIDLSVEEI